MRLVKNAIEVAANLEDCVFTSEKVQMLFDDRKHFLEICEYHPNAPRLEPVFRVELVSTPERRTICDDILVNATLEDAAHFGNLEDAMKCLVDTISSI